MERVIGQGWTIELAEISANGCTMDLGIDTESENASKPLSYYVSGPGGYCEC